MIGGEGESVAIVAGRDLNVQADALLRSEELTISDDAR